MLREGRLDLLLPRCPGLGVAAGIAAIDPHLQPGKAGGQVVAEGLDHHLLGVDHAPDLFIGVQLSPLELEDGLDVEDGRHGRPGGGHPPPLAEVFQGAHRHVDAGQGALLFQDVPDFLRRAPLGQEDLSPEFAAIAAQLSAAFGQPLSVSVEPSNPTSDEEAAAELAGERAYDDEDAGFTDEPVDDEEDTE